jgi:hypothetical protein
MSGLMILWPERTYDGKPIKMLTVMDEYTRKCLAIKVARRIRSDDVLHTLTDLFVVHGILRIYARIMAANSPPRRCGAC